MVLPGTLIPLSLSSLPDTPSWMTPGRRPLRPPDPCLGRAVVTLHLGKVAAPQNKVQVMVGKCLGRYLMSLSPAI